jgi:hypothetical protein
MLHKMDFAIWKRRRDGILHHNIGVTSDDLSDAPWYDYWEQDLDPQAAIEAAIEDYWYDEPLIRELLKVG